MKMFVISKNLNIKTKLLNLKIEEFKCLLQYKSEALFSRWVNIWVTEICNLLLEFVKFVYCLDCATFLNNFHYFCCLVCSNAFLLVFFFF